MGLDIYAGTLTRYYSHDWKNITQQLSEELGKKCVMLDGCGNEIIPEKDKNVIEGIRNAVSNGSTMLRQISIPHFLLHYGTRKANMLTIPINRTGKLMEH